MRSLSVIAVIAFGAALSAQEGASTMPRNYTAQFENAWVKVTSVRYEPLEKLPGHSHTPTASAYVYLNDGPPVKFRHIGGHNTIATRPATKAGAFRVYRGLDEVHEVENTGNEPSEFLRIELKTQGVHPEGFRGKFERPPSPAANPLVHFDHQQIRISRLWARPGEAIAIARSPEPALLVALGDGAGLTTGQVRWIPASTEATFTNAGENPLDFLRFDFKTRPTGTVR